VPLPSVALGKVTITDLFCWIFAFHHDKHNISNISHIHPNIYHIHHIYHMHHNIYHIYNHKFSSPSKQIHKSIQTNPQVYHPVNNKCKDNYPDPQAPH
jgi:hypothetical protein